MIHYQIPKKKFLHSLRKFSCKTRTQGKRVVKRSTRWNDAFQMLWTACQISSHRAKLELRRRPLLLAPLRSPPTFLSPTPTNHIFFSLCCRLWFVESKAAGPPWRQQSKFNIRLWGGKRIVLSACTQSHHWLVQKSRVLPHPKNDQSECLT